MHANIIAGGTKQTRELYIRSLLSPQIDLLHLYAESASLTLKQVHGLISSLGVIARFPRLIWIEEANLLTPPSQNALLKLLEEPPQNTTIYLTCRSARALLPTIASRCQTIALPTNDLRSTIYALRSLKEIMSLSVGDRLAGISKMDRATALIWFTTLEVALCDKLHARSLSPSQLTTLGKIAHLALAGHEKLLSNCSVSLVRESFLLHLPRVV